MLSTFGHGLLIKQASLQALAITTMCDADWANDPDDRRSVSGSWVFLRPNLVFWGLRNRIWLLGLELK